MVRASCCEKVGLKRGRWTAEEDEILRKYVEANGEGSWKSIPKNAGLKRCGKSCRLRWVNYLRGDLKKENFTSEEVDLIIKMHNTLGSRWSMMARNLPGRTDNEIKNYWNSHLSRSVHTFRRPIGEYPATYAVDIVKMGSNRKGKGRTSQAAMKKKTYITNNNHPHKIPSNAEKWSVGGLIPSVQRQEATLNNGEESDQNRFIQGPHLEACMLVAENIACDGMLSSNEKENGVITMSEEQLGLLCSHSSREGESYGIISSSSSVAAKSTSDQWYSSACSITSCFEDEWVNLIIEGPNSNDEQEFLSWLWDRS